MMAAVLYPKRARALSRRECETMWLVAEGLTNKEIAERLLVSESTIKYNVLRASFKLGAHTRTRAAVRFVVERMAILPPSFIEGLRATSPAIVTRQRP